MRAATWSLGLYLWGAACSQAPGGTGAELVPADGVVGLVAAVKGTVWVEHAGGARDKAEEGGSLSRSDRLSPDPDAFVVVLLKNKQVMKIAAPTPVAKIAVLDAPESSTDLEAMLRQQLGSEYSGVIDDQKLQRIAGWSQSMAAGEIVAPTLQQASPAQPGSVPETETKSAGQAVGVSSRDAKPEKNVGDTKKVPGNLGGSGGAAGLETDPVTGRAEKKSGSPDKWVFLAKNDAGEASERTGLPRALAQAWGALGDCLRGAAELRVEVEGGKITAVTPAGCSAELVGKPVAELSEAGTIVVELR